jgi:hypothetical protein
LLFDVAKVVSPLHLRSLSQSLQHHERKVDHYRCKLADTVFAREEKGKKLMQPVLPSPQHFEEGYTSNRTVCPRASGAMRFVAFIER